MKIKKGDEVIVIAGKDRGKKGEVLKAFPQENRVIVKGINIQRRHTRPSPIHPEGGIVEKEAKLHVSNVAYVDPESGKQTRVGYRFNKDGTKVRFAKKSGALI